jgi:hypothetical protein
MSSDPSDSAASDAPDGPGAMPEGERADLIRQRALLAHALSNDHHGQRNYYKVFGWDRSPDVADYYASYLRNPYAKRVVDAPAETAWRDDPEITDNQDTDGETDTAFEQDLEALIDSCDPWHYSKRADKLQGIGQFGVLLIGWADGADLPFAAPVARTALRANDPADAIEWFRPLSQLSVETIRYGEPGSGRYREPEYYKIDLDDENDATTADVFGDDSEQWFHHERVLHLAEGKLDDEVRGTPRQQAPFNALTDIQKTLGSAPETAYSNARPGLHANVDKDYQLTDDGASIADELTGYVHDQEPLIKTQGVDINRIAGETVDPQPVMNELVGAVTTATGIPKSVLRGKELADTAKSEDKSQYFGLVGEHRRGFLTPSVVRELVSRCVEFGAITPPANGPRAFAVEWPPLEERSEQETADVQLARSKVAKNIQSLVPGYSSEEWIAVIEDGEFPEVPDAEPEIDPADIAALERRVAEQEQGQNQPPGTEQPAIADGGANNSED